MKWLAGYFLPLATVAVLFLFTVYGSIFPELNLTYRAIDGAALCLLAIIVEFFKARPSLTFQEKFGSLMEPLSTPKHAQWQTKDKTVRINVMRLDRVLPFAQLGWFKIIYSMDMDDADDHDLTLGSWQGICGEAALKGKFFAYYLEEGPQPTFRMSARQREKTAGITFVASMPIKYAKKGEDGKLVIQDKIIGVINLDSKQSKAKELYSGDHLADIETSLGNLSRLCSIMLS